MYSFLHLDTGIETVFSSLVSPSPRRPLLRKDAWSCRRRSSHAFVSVCECFCKLQCHIFCLVPWSISSVCWCWLLCTCFSWRTMEIAPSPRQTQPTVLSEWAPEIRQTYCINYKLYKLLRFLRILAGCSAIESRNLIVIVSDWHWMMVTSMLLLQRGSKQWC